MNPSSIALCLLLPLTPTAGDPQVDEPRPASVLRTYDLAALTGLYDGGGITEYLFPSMTPVGWQEPYDVDLFEDGVDVVVGLLQHLTGDEFDYQGRSLTVDDRERLVVLAPPSVQKDVQAILAGLEGAVAAATELGVDVLEVEADHALPESAVVSEGAARDWIARAVEAGAVQRSFRLPVRPGQTGIVDLSREIELVVDYDVEIAQAGWIHDPNADVVNVGTRLVVRGTPGEGGLALALVIRNGEAVDGPRTLEIPMSGFVSTEQGWHFLDGPKRYQTLEVLSRNLAFNTFLPDGKALVLHSSLDLQSGASRQVFVLRRTGPKLPAQQVLELGSQGGRVKVANLEVFTSPRFATEGSLLREGPQLPLALTGDRGALHDSVYSSLELGDWDLAMEFASNDLSGMGEQLGPWFLSALSAEQLADLEAEPAQAFSSVLDSWKPETRVVQLELIARHPGDGGHEAARVTLPLRAGTSGVALAGFETTEVADYDVEVAQFAAVADPSPFVAFDGLVFWARPAYTPAGDLLVDVRVRVHFREGEIQELDLRSPVLGQVQQSTYERLFVNERLRFPASGSNRSVVLGDTSNGGSEGSLAVEIAVR